MEPHIANVHERPDIEAGIKRPREKAKPPSEVKSTHFLGLPDDDKRRLIAFLLTLGREPPASAH